MDLNEIIKEIPLKTRIKVSAEMAFINLITELGYREPKVWTEEENELYNQLINLAEDFTNNILEEFEQWEKDGKP